MLLVLLARAYASPCPTPTTTDSLVEALTAAEVGFTKRDRNALTTYRAEAVQTLACVEAVLAPVDIGRLYLVLGLDAFVNGDRRTTQAWFEAARTLDPDIRLPDALPAGHPASTLLEGVSAVPLDWVPLPPPREGSILVNGVAGAPAPAGRAWVFQHVVDGSIRTTELVDADAAPPTYPTRRAGRLRVGVGLWSLPNASATDVPGVVSGLVRLPATAGLDADIGAFLGIHGKGLVPGVRFGVSHPFGAATVVPRVGVAVDLTAHADGGEEDDAIGLVVRPGFGLPIGVTVAPSAWGVDLEVLPSFTWAHTGGSTPSLRAQVGVSRSW